MTTPNADPVPTKRPDHFRIEHNGFEWAGSFDQAITAVIQGCLDNDGATAMNLLLIDNDDNVVSVGVVVVGLTEDHILTEQGDRFQRWGQLLGIELP